jgi:hypothetical protein
MRRKAGVIACARVGSSRPSRCAAEIIKRCTGEVTFGEVVDDLAEDLCGAAR